MRKFLISVLFYFSFSGSAFAEPQFAPQCPLFKDVATEDPSGLTSIGDIDSDGINDFIFVVPKFSSSSTAATNILRVWSGKELRQIAEFQPPEAKKSFGSNFSNAGDLDGDGFNDIFVGAQDRFEEDNFAEVAEAAGSVYAFSPVSNKLIFTLNSPAPAYLSGNNSFGSAVTTLGDLNGDGKAEIAVSADGIVYPELINGSGAVFIFDGASLKVLNILTLNNPEISGLGRVLFSISDLNQDGYRDLIVGATIEASDLSKRGVLLVYNGLALVGLRNRSLIGTIIPDEALLTFGLNVIEAGDLNGDGRVELAVSSPDRTNESGDILILSTSLLNGRLSFEPILNIPPALPANSDFGTSMSLLPDIDGDNFPEIAVASPLYTAGGLLEIVSLKTGDIILSLTGESSVFLGDLNQDGFQELLAASALNDTLYVYTISPDRNQNSLPDRCELLVTEEEEDISVYYNLIGSLKKSLLDYTRDFKAKFPKRRGFLALRFMRSDLLSIKELVTKYPQLVNFSPYLTLKNLALIDKKLSKLRNKGVKIGRTKDWKKLVFLLKNLF